MVHCTLAHLSSHESVVKTTHFKTFYYLQTNKAVDRQTCCAKVVCQVSQNPIVKLHICNLQASWQQKQHIVPDALVQC